MYHYNLKITNFYYERKDYNNGDNAIYIENTDERFFEKMKKIWNKIIELLGITYAEDFVQYTLDDNSKYIAADSVVDDILMASLLELREFEY